MDTSFSQSLRNGPNRNQVAHTDVDQVFLNDTDVDSVEGRYIFPLPKDAAFSDLSMFVDGEKLPAEVLNADSVRAIYESTVHRNRAPLVREDRPCPDQPFRAPFLVFDGRGTLSATFRSDEQGRFRVTLTPGAYTIIPDESAPIIHPTGHKKAVQVSENKFTQVTLIFDTGIR